MAPKASRRLGAALACAALLARAPMGARGQEQTPPILPDLKPAPLPPRVVLPPPPARPEGVPTTPLTAEEAARIALRRQPAIASARAAAESAAGRTRQVRSGLLPSLGLGAGYTRSEGPGGSSAGGAGSTGGAASFPGWQLTASARQLLFDFERTRDLVRQASALERAAEASLTRAQLDAVFQVKQAFYAYVQSERLVQVNEANVQSRQDQFTLAQARLAAGLGIPADTVRAQTAVAAAVLALSVARNNAAQARVSLALAMGIDPRTPLSAAQSGEPAPSGQPVGTLVDGALRARPEIVQARETVAAAEHGVDAARATDAPSVSLSLGAGARGPNLPPANRFVSVGASIQWTPFDSGLTAGRVREARGAIDAARAQLEAARLSVTADVSRAYLDLRTAEQQVATTDAEAANAEESLRLAQGRYRAGVGTFLEVTDAQAALLEARTNGVNARSAVDLARAAMAHAIGAPIFPR